jgi:hypothetical protein
MYIVMLTASRALSTVRTASQTRRDERLTITRVPYLLMVALSSVVGARHSRYKTFRTPAAGHFTAGGECDVGRARDWLHSLRRPKQGTTMAC